MGEQVMRDEAGFRLNVGIVLANEQGQLLLARRLNRADAWQFPQGGMQVGETPLEAMYRELEEELGLLKSDVTCLAETSNWLKYTLPEALQRFDAEPPFVGQTQKWFLLRLLSGDERVSLDRVATPEFDCWKWVDYWYPLERVVDFKRAVYQQVLETFSDVV